MVQTAQAQQQLGTILTTQTVRAQQKLAQLHIALALIARLTCESHNY
jgi:hypothetical protein